MWIKEEDVPGLAMTRSIGDFIGTKIGVISEPEIIYHSITENDRFLILATDGVWEVVTNQTAIEIVHKYYLKRDIEGAKNELLEYSKKQWKKVRLYYLQYYRIIPLQMI